MLSLNVEIVSQRKIDYNAALYIYIYYEIVHEAHKKENKV